MESSDEEMYTTQNSFSSFRDALPELDFLDQVLFDEVCLVESLLETNQTHRSVTERGRTTKTLKMAQTGIFRLLVTTNSKSSNRLEYQ